MYGENYTDRSTKSKKNVKDDNSFNYNEFEDQEIKFDENIRACFD